VNDGTLRTATTALKHEFVGCNIAVSESIIVEEFKHHKTMGGLILIDRVSHATAACGVVEEVSNDQEGVFLQDGQSKVRVNLFDSFWYDPDVNMVLRDSYPSTVYQPGDTLPLQSQYCNYPSNFDIKFEMGFVNVREGKFVGIGARDNELPLLDANGLAVDAHEADAFAQYRNILVRKKTEYFI